jgi:RNA polymerase sigma-70 factor (ECF subfamily)
LNSSPYSGKISLRALPLKPVTPAASGTATAVDFNSVYAAFYARILRYLTRLVGPDEAEDVSQEVFSKISRSLGEFRGDALSSWVYRIATNAATDRMRRTSAHPSITEDEDISLPDPGDSAEQQVIRGEMSACVRDLTNELPDSYRTVLVLSEIEGLKDAEIAEVVGATVQAVKIRLHRARARLRQIMEERCRFYRDGENTLLCDRKASPDPIRED